LVNKIKSGSIESALGSLDEISLDFLYQIASIPCVDSNQGKTIQKKSNVDKCKTLYYSLRRMVRDIIIETLIIESDREQHITKHNITIDEVLEVISEDYVFIQGKLDRWLLVGKTKKERFLTIVVGEREKKDTYGFVTARPSRKEEKSFYQEFTLQGGDENDKS
jgi:uncharacterized DUF497 family protein